MSFSDNWGGNGGGRRGQTSYSLDSFDERKSKGGRGLGATAESVANEIRQYSTNVTQVESMAKNLGTHRDSASMRGQMSALIHTTRELTKDVTESLKAYDAANKGPEKRIQQQKLAKDLQYWVTKFQEVSRHASDREKSIPVPQQQAPSSKRNNLPSSFPINDGYAPTPYNDELREEESVGLVNAQRREQQYRMQNEIEFQNAIIADRDQDLRDIEKSVSEVNEIFRDLSTLVVEQGQMIDSIESNIEAAVKDTDKGVEEIKKASNYQSKSRTKLCCLALILVLILAVAGVFVYLFGIRKLK